MKLHLLLPFLALGLAALHAADPAPAQPAAKAADLSGFKTADDLWKHIETLQKPPAEKPTTREQAIAQAVPWLKAQKEAGEAFAKAFPADVRRWPAQLMGVRAAGQLGRITGEVPPPEAERAKFDEIINAADAPAPVKAEAAFMRAVTFVGEFKTKPQSYIAFHEAAADFAAKYAAHPLAPKLEELNLRTLADDPTPEGAALLRKYAASTDAKVAETAKGILKKRERTSELKSKPVDLKFTTTTNQDADLALMRGKVVLVDFWASWCGPCIAEMPNVVATYQKLHPNGFEILGISLDEDKDKMQEAMKKHGMTWAQYFDGLGWKNKISSSYGIDSIPATWLIDKKGMLRESGLRGDALEQAVVRLLKE